MAEYDYSQLVPKNLFIKMKVFDHKKLAVLKSVFCVCVCVCGENDLC